MDKLTEEKILTAAIRNTNHAALEVGDLVIHPESDLCLKILAIDAHLATVSDTKSEFQVPISELALSEALMVATYQELYGDRLMVIEMP